MTEPSAAPNAAQPRTVGIEAEFVEPGTGTELPDALITESITAICASGRRISLVETGCSIALMSSVSTKSRPDGSGVGPRGADRLRVAGATRPATGRRPAGGVGEVDQVALHDVGDVDGGGHLHHLDDIGSGHHRLQLDGRPGPVGVEHLQLLLRLGAHCDPHHEG